MLSGQQARQSERSVLAPEAQVKCQKFRTPYDCARRKAPLLRLF